MIKVMTYGFAVLMLVALGIATRQGWFHSADQAVLKGKAQPEVLDSRRGSQMELNAMSPRSSRNLSPSSLAPLSSSPESTGLTAISQQNSVSESQSPIAPDAQASDPNEVVGRPFPISPSVENPCRQEIAEDPKTASCNQVLQLLSTMAQEPRDPTWAAAMETKLRELVMGQPTPFTVRTIECRTSLCAIEVTSIYGALHNYPDYLGPENLLDNKLRPGIGLFGYEEDPSSSKVTVTLLTYKRR